MNETKTTPTKTKNNEPTERQITPVRRRFPKVATGIKAGPSRRADLDHVGAYNFKVR